MTTMTETQTLLPLPTLEEVQSTMAGTIARAIDVPESDIEVTYLGPGHFSVSGTRADVLKVGTYLAMARFDVDHGEPFPHEDADWHCIYVYSEAMEGADA